MAAGHRLTEVDIEKVRAFSQAGMRSKHIAKSLGLSKCTVSHVQRDLGMSPYDTRPLPQVTVQKVLGLLRGRRGSPYIARLLEMPRHKVEQVMREHQYRRCAYNISPQLKRI